MWTCDGNTAAQNWTVATNGTLQIDGGCMDITGAATANGTLIEWWTCNGGANQQWVAENGELVNPSSGKCLDDPASNTDERHSAGAVDLQRRHQPALVCAVI